jgi:Ca2+-transporting ATPase
MDCRTLRLPSRKVNWVYCGGGPRAFDAPVFDRRMIEQVAIGGTAIGLLAFAFYYLTLQRGVPHPAAQCAVLWLLVCCENAHCFNCRSETRSILKIPFANNLLLVGAVIGTQVLQLVVLAVPPVRELLSLEALTPTAASRLAVAGLAIMLVMEIYKSWRVRRAE